MAASEDTKANTELQFRQNDPGAVQFGNFINYYQFHPPKERLELLPSSESRIWLSENDNAAENEQELPYLVLDVGCNAGDLTAALWRHLNSCTSGRPVHILGVDIDPMLVERAQLDNRHPEHISYCHADVMADDEFAQVEAYLQRYARRTFDAICCFSVTMWIHLNHNDSGLQRFLRRMAGIAELLVVEPQPWKCYTAADRRMRRAAAASVERFPYYKVLKWRSEVEQEIQKYLEEKLGRRKVYESMATKWKRKICFYR